MTIDEDKFKEYQAITKDRFEELKRLTDRLDELHEQKKQAINQLLQLAYCAYLLGLDSAERQSLSVALVDYCDSLATEYKRSCKKFDIEIDRKMLRPKLSFERKNPTKVLRFQFNQQTYIAKLPE